MLTKSHSTYFNVFKDCLETCCLGEWVEGAMERIGDSHFPPHKTLVGEKETPRDLSWGTRVLSRIAPLKQTNQAVSYVGTTG